MRTAAGILKAPPYFSKDDKQKLPIPSKADILPLDYVPAVCRQNEQGQNALSDYELSRTLAQQMKLSGKAMREAEKARENGHSTFRHVFGKHGKCPETPNLIPGTRNVKAFFKKRLLLHTARIQAKRPNFGGMHAEVVVFYLKMLLHCGHNMAW